MDKQINICPFLCYTAKFYKNIISILHCKNLRYILLYNFFVVKINKRRGKYMIEIKRLYAKLIVKVAKKVTQMDANVSCPFVGYQPKLPKGAEKLKRYK